MSEWAGHDEGHELALFIENDGEMYRHKKAILESLHRKMKAGTYKSHLAPKAWIHLVDAGARKYAKEYSVGSDWNKMFTKKERDHVARWFAQHEEHRLRSGEYGLRDPHRKTHHAKKRSAKHPSKLVIATAIALKMREAKTRRDPSKTMHKSWQLWSKASGEPHFIEIFKDKASARRKMRALLKSHPYNHGDYYLKHVKAQSRQVFERVHHAHARLKKYHARR